ncbi:MAG: helix-turn-helix transcriptional regulator [Clostridia bacterium]|nr:helix-turn-helix transcriptional regulator [Clostridia bacterium]
MYGIDLEKPIAYVGSSLRFFEKNERHVERICMENVLLLVYDGVLRFSEDGAEYEIQSGQYFIQRMNGYQRADNVSDSPKYLYVHFLGEWGDGETCLSRSGNFDYSAMSTIMQKMDKLSHGNYTYTERAGVLYEILSMLYRSTNKIDTPASRIRRFISQNYLDISSLEDICEEFHYSKNHVINIFREEYGITPFEYLNDVRIRRSMYLLEVTSKSIDEIARESGFNHYSHFYRLFIRKNAVSPIEWRRRVRVEARFDK